MTLGTLVAFLSFAGHLANPIQEMARTITLIQGAQASAERILGLIDTEPAIADSPEVAASDRPEPHTIGRIEFEEVTFGYDPDVPVLRDFTLVVEPGQTVAFVGPTGGGKSTVVALLCRFYEPTQGRIVLDGVEYRQRRVAWLQSKLGIVLQTPHLFSGSIRENIRYGRIDASDEQVADAARIVNAEAFINDLPDGYETEVGEGGSQLSTGQNQLVALARAILADPQVFVMDEATSSVDTETEQLIQTGIDRVLGSRTAFVIAHRLSTIRNADRIVVIDNGRIVEHGTHAELMQVDGHYNALYRQHVVDERLLSGPEC
jgi:ATP-binding cassette subfamily B protein